jgi:CRP-like cAMP-binding protein
MVAEDVDAFAALRQSFLFADVDDEELTQLARSAVVRAMVRGETLHRPGDPADELFILVSGEVKEYVVTLDGEEIVHFLRGAGMTFGEPGYFAVERNRVVHSMAIRPTVVLVLKREHLEPLMERHPAIKDRALENLASHMRWYGSLVSTLVSRPLEERLLVRLLELADSTRHEASGPLSTPDVSQSMLAAMLGVTRENVNRALASLVSGGWIERIGGRYVFLDEARARQAVARDLPITARPDRRRG